jgi:hypothetical protein
VADGSRARELAHAAESRGRPKPSSKGFPAGHVHWTLPAGLFEVRTTLGGNVYRVLFCLGRHDGASSRVSEEDSKAPQASSTLLDDE